MYESGGKRNM
jgi:hypothetical protein